MNFVNDVSDIRTLARNVAEKSLVDPPWANTDDAFSREKVSALAAAGLLGMGLPADVGGGGASTVELVTVTEELAKVSTSAAFVFGAQNGLGAKAIAHLGKPKMKEQYMPGVLSGEVLTSWAMSEPGAGSDLGRMTTRLEETAEGTVLNGEKTWVSLAQYAGVFVVICRVSGEPGLRGIGAVVLDRDTQGLTVGPHIDTMGINGTGMASVFFDNCPVPPESILVPAGGYKDVLRQMSAERIASNPPISLGLASAALDATVGFLKQRNAFGSPLAHQQGLRWRVAEMALDLEAARSLVYQAASNVDEGRVEIKEAAMAKIAANEAAIRITDAAVIMHGAAGFTKDMRIERLARDAKGMAIGDGTVHIQRNLLANEILGRVS